MLALRLAAMGGGRRCSAMVVWLEGAWAEDKKNRDRERASRGEDSPRRSSTLKFTTNERQREHLVDGGC